MKRVTLQTLITWFFVLLLIIQGTVNLFAQEITDEDLERIKREKEFAEARKAIAEAELAELKAKYPAPKSTPLEGKTTINDGAVIESQMMAYAAMAQAANKIAAAVHGKDTGMDVLVIYSQNEVNNLLGYRAADNQLEILKNNYCEILPSGASGVCPSMGVAVVIGPLMLLQSFLGGFVDTLALLRTNVEIKGQTFDIEEQSLVSETFRALRSKYGGNLALYYPSVYPLGIDGNTQSDFLGKLEMVRKLKLLSEIRADSLGKTLADLKKTETDLNVTVAAIADIGLQKAAAHVILAELLSVRRPDALERIKIAELRAQIGVFEKSLIDLGAKQVTLAGKKATLVAQRDALLVNLSAPYSQAANADEALAKLRGINQQFDQFVTSLIQINPTTGSNLITGFIKAKNLDKAMKCGNAVAPAGCTSATLQLKVLKAGGNNRIKTNLIVDVFTGGNRLSHSGGSIVQYNLFTPTGKSILSDTLTVYADYIKSNQVRNLPARIKDTTGQDIDVP